MPHHPSEAVIIGPRQRFMGVGVDGSPIYRRPRHGSKTKSGEPERLVLEDNIPALPKEQSTFDLFPRGIRFYNKPPTRRTLLKAWNGGLLGQPIRLERVVGSDGMHVNAATDMGIFGQYRGFPTNPELSVWVDPSRTIKPNTSFDK